MALSTEIFVMMIFIAGLPVYYRLLRDPELEGAQWFLTAYALLVVSNIATVGEEFFWNEALNFIEHLMIALSSLVFVLAVLRLTRKPDQTGPSETHRA